MSQFIVHLVNDDKFIDMALREFEAVMPGASRAVIIGAPRALRYIKSARIEFMSYGQAKALFRAPECQGIIFHSLNERFIPLLSAVPKGKRAIWLGWGYDYYDLLLSKGFPNGLLLPLTKRLVGRSFLIAPRERLLGYAKYIAKRALGWRVHYDRAVLNKIDYFVPVLEGEHRMATALNPWFTAKYVPWNYGTVEDDWAADGVGGRPGAPARNILVGNSATPENNHLDIFRVLKTNIDIDGRQIVVPLSYGDAWYREKIVREGYRIFGQQFTPLLGFMPRDEYIELIGGCGHVFMNHIRQQALGNICIMMLKGATLYLNEINPLFSWLTEQGAALRSIDALGRKDLNSRISLVELSEAEKEANADIIKSHWARGVQRNKTRHLINLALGKAAH